MPRRSSLNSSSPRSELKWPRSTELVALSFQVQPRQAATVFPQYVTGLHAWFLDQIRQSDPILAQTLHDEPEEKAFALSGLEGVFASAGHRLQLSAQQTYQWTVSVFSEAAVRWMAQWLPRLPLVIELRHVSLKILQVKYAHPPTTYQQLFRPPTAQTIALSFLSPTSFRRKGYHFPLPLPFNVFHSYLRRWNTFSGNPFEPEPFLAWVDENVLILRHRLQSVKVAAGKKGSVTGFTGSIEYGLAAQAQAQPGFVQLLLALAALAPYCGTGHKTPFGLGQTRLGWQGEAEEVSLPSASTLLAQRIEQLTQQLMQSQKRTGGSRATHICQTRATLLARREMGESLSDIAQDLEIPYETAKTYTKIARRLLRTASS